MCVCVCVCVYSTGVFQNAEDALDHNSYLKNSIVIHSELVNRTEELFFFVVVVVVIFSWSWFPESQVHFLHQSLSNTLNHKWARSPSPWSNLWDGYIKNLHNFAFSSKCIITCKKLSRHWLKGVQYLKLAKMVICSWFVEGLG